jgi:hypothetical protein
MVTATVGGSSSVAASCGVLRHAVRRLTSTSIAMAFSLIFMV